MNIANNIINLQVNQKERNENDIRIHRNIETARTNPA